MAAKGVYTGEESATRRVLKFVGLWIGLFVGSFLIGTLVISPIYTYAFGEKRVEQPAPTQTASAATANAPPPPQRDWKIKEPDQKPKPPSPDAPKVEIGTDTPEPQPVEPRSRTNFVRPSQEQQPDRTLQLNGVATQPDFIDNAASQPSMRSESPSTDRPKPARSTERKSRHKKTSHKTDQSTQLKDEPLSSVVQQGESIDH